MSCIRDIEWLGEQKHTILASRDFSQDEIDAKAVFATPLKDSNYVSEERIRKTLARLGKNQTHFQLVFARNGSPGYVSIAQYPMGSLTQVNPAPAISAMSFSV